MNKLVHWLEAHQGQCSWKHLFGLPCPGCGMQSAFIALLKGDIPESIRMFPALIPMIVMLAFLVAHIFFRFQKGAMLLKFLFIFTSSIMVISYIIKLFIK